MSPRAVCPACDRVVGGKSPVEAEQGVEDHNKRMHGEEEVALVVSDHVDEDELNSLMDHAKEVTNQEQYEAFVDTVINQEDNFGV